MGEMTRLNNARQGGVDKYQVNQRVFGHAGFRPGQELLIDAILEGRDCLGVMPTGGGKSLCYQIPALMLPGLTLVISPLISLMKDQVTALLESGIPTAFWNSSMTLRELQGVRQGVAQGTYKLLYVAPERLDSADFCQMMASAHLSLVAVDEAHCVSQWGQDFRPSYLKISQFIRRLPTRPVVAAFTATATPAVREDIAQKLALRDPQTLVTGFDRPNLFFDVLEPKKNKLGALVALLKERQGRSGIVYCATRRAVDEVYQGLLEARISAARYHAGMAPDERRRSQEAFQYDNALVMVATNAFGMGIDKSNVSYVIHYNMPMSLEAYYQEAGRAGRDGEPADCILLYSPQDINTAQFLIQNRQVDDALSEDQVKALIRQDIQRLDQMVGYCTTFSCYRGCILDYFGQEHPDSCGNCGNCNTNILLQDVTQSAQMILSCVQRIKNTLGYYVGPALVVQVLRGSKKRRVLELRLDQLSTYGLLSTLPQRTIRNMVDFLVRQGYAEIERDYNTLRLTSRAKGVLFQGVKVEMPVKHPVPLPTSPAVQEQTGPAQRQDLYDRLAALRLELARRESVPAYVIFSNATLRDMAQKAPATPAAFLQVNGVGEVKAQRYGELFLHEIQIWLNSRENKE